MTLPLADGDERLDELHPRFISRLERFFNHPDIKGRFTISSAVRTYASQKYLYDGWVSRKSGFNLAANPDAAHGTTDEGWMQRGSWHMPQADGYAYAVDFRKPWHMRRSTAQSIIDRVAPIFGIKRTVASEWWHVQPRSRSGWFFDSSMEATDEGIAGMETLIDTTSGDHWAAANGKADKLSEPAKWMEGWEGPVRKSPNMRFVIPTLYDVVG